MTTTALIERLYALRWWILLPLVVVSVFVGTSARPAAWIAGFLLILLVWIPGAFMWARVARRAGRSFREGLHGA